MATLEISSRQQMSGPSPTGWAGLEAGDLLRNARWFTCIRWGVVLTMGLFAFLERLWPGLLPSVGVRSPFPHLIPIALALAASNLFYILQLHRYSETTPRRCLFRNLWIQILFDLAAVTVLVHLAGSTTTSVSLAYLFHIVLACVFFAPPYSLLVTLLSAFLFLTIVTLEQTGTLATHSILISVSAPAQGSPASLLYAFSSILFWMAVWCLMAFIAQTLRRRDRQLAEANQQLVEADERSNQQVLRTTHDLKAPFSGIESNILLLNTLYRDQLPEPGQELIEEIRTRSMALRERIRDILMLGAIKSQDQAGKANIKQVDIPALVAETLKDVENRIQQRNISIHVVGDAGTVYASPTHLKTALINLVCSVLLDTQDGGTVPIGILRDTDGTVTVSISDHGIGIREDALPHIFDEYYRTGEAATFNAMSTGLGLAIVKRIAQNNGLTIRVDSQVDKGTTFDVIIPLRTMAAADAYTGD